MKVGRRVGALIGALVLVLVSACTASDTSGTTGPSESTGSEQLASKITIALGGTPTTLNPFGAVSPPATYYYHLVYDALTAFNASGELIPGLATSWTQTDGNIWTLKLRTDVKFSNGESLTAAGVKKTLDYLKANPSELASAQIASVSSITAPDNATLVLTTSAPDPILLSKLTMLPIPASEAFTANPESFASQAIGTGPYVVSSYEAGQRLDLTAASGSWRGTPKTPEISFISMPDPATRVSALKAGQIDVAQNIGPDDIDSLKSSGNIIQGVRRGQIQQVMFEVASHPDSPIAKLEVRQALNHAIDVPTIINTVLGGEFTPSSGQSVNSDGVGYNPNVQAYPYDPDKAKQLLAAAGYPDGFSITLEMTTGSFPNDEQAYNAVVSYLEAAGVKVTVQTIPLSQFVQALRAGPRDELFIAGLQYIPELDTAKAMGWWLCTAADAAKRNCVPELDEVMAEASKTLDPTARETLLQTANAIFHDNALSIPLWQLTDIWAVRDGVTGWVERSDAVLDLDVLTATAI